jgi:hypothetical protein
MNTEEQKFNPPYFYMGLAEEEHKKESLEKIRVTNYDYIGRIVEERGDYVIRYSRDWGSYPILHETWDGCAENFILEVRNKEQAIEILNIVAKHGRKIWKLIDKLEKIYCKEQRAFMNYYFEEHTAIVAGFIKGLKREIENLERSNGEYDLRTL